MCAIRLLVAPGAGANMDKDGPLMKRAHSARRLRLNRWPGGPVERRSALIAAVTWSAALTGFGLYLLKLGDLHQAYGGVSTALLLVLWLTLFGVIYYATPRMRLAATPVERGAQPGPPPPAMSAASDSALADQVDLVTVPSAALRNSTAQGRMMSALGARGGMLADRQLELMSWGFAYGVAWAIARRQHPAATQVAISERALEATQAVYEAYCGSTAPPGPPDSAPHADAHRR
jgi:hypothetical protein